MTWSHRERPVRGGELESVRFATTGRGDEWGRLQEKVFAIVDSIAERIQESSHANEQTVEASAETLKDLSSLAVTYARAKVEHPSLENEKLKAEIASEFAEAKRRYAEAMKLEAETRKIEVETRSARLVADLDNLERLMKLATTMAHITFSKVGKDGHLRLGSDRRADRQTGRGRKYA